MYEERWSEEGKIKTEHHWRVPPPETWLSTCGSRPFGIVWPFHRSPLWPFAYYIFTLQFITVEKYNCEEATRVILWSGRGVTIITLGTVLKGRGVRKVEHHWSRAFCLERIQHSTSLQISPLLFWLLEDQVLNSALFQGSQDPELWGLVLLQTRRCLSPGKANRTASYTAEVGVRMNLWLLHSQESNPNGLAANSSTPSSPHLPFVPQSPLPLKPNVVI